MHLPTSNLESRKARDAARLALQAAVAVAVMFGFMEAAGLPEKFVGVLSAVLVVQPTIGSTLNEASQRFVATLVGSVIGVVCLALIPSGYGTAAALAISCFLMYLIAAFRSEWRYGVVAAVALALGSNGDTFRTAFDRSLAIGIGVIVGAVATLVIWPDRAEKRAERYLSAALRAAAERLDLTVKATLGKGDTEADEQRRAFHRNFELAKSAAGATRFFDTEPLMEKIDAVEHLYNSILFLNRVVEESADPLVTKADLDRAVETIRGRGCEIAVGLARDERDHDSRLAAIRAALEKLTVEAPQSKGEPRVHLLENAMVFALDEIEDGLKRLVELYPEESQES